MHYISQPFSTSHSEEHSKIRLPLRNTKPLFDFARLSFFSTSCCSIRAHSRATYMRGGDETGSRIIFSIRALRKIEFTQVGIRPSTHDHFLGYRERRDVERIAFDNRNNISPLIFRITARWNYIII